MQMSESYRKTKGHTVESSALCPAFGLPHLQRASECEASIIHVSRYHPWFATRTPTTLTATTTNNNNRPPFIHPPTNTTTAMVWWQIIQVSYKWLSVTRGSSVWGSSSSSEEITSSGMIWRLPKMSSAQNYQLVSTMFNSQLKLFWRQHAHSGVQNRPWIMDHWITCAKKCLFLFLNCQHPCILGNCFWETWKLECPGYFPAK